MNRLTHSTKPTKEKQINRNWHLIDVSGKVLGRIAPQIVKLVQGKNKTDYVPNLDIGDHVVVINASKVRVTGKKVLSVSRGSFRPAPKVDSAVIKLDLRKKWLENIDPEEVLKIVKAGFSSRRKQLHGNLAKSSRCSSETTKAILKKLGLSEKARAENLSVENWVKFYGFLKENKSEED